MTRIDPRTLAVLSTVLLVSLLGGLLVQHLRHGWPFSLHHGLPTESGSVAPAEPASEHASVTHPRVEVELESADLDKLGIRLVQARTETIAQPIRTPATVVPDESRVAHVHTRVSGWIERLYVQTTGERVRAGQALAGIFSQELLSAQAEYLALRRPIAGPAPRSVLVDGARARLKVLGMNEADIAAIERSGEPRRLVTVTAPRSGVALHRGVSVGTAVDPSTEILTLADLSKVWVLAEIPEVDIPRIAVGTPARLEFAGSGRAPFEAAVEFLYPTLTERTRTLRVRFAVDNPDGSLRPGIYGTATFRVEPREAVTIPRDAVVDTGATQHVFVAAQTGRFVPRDVHLGVRLGDRVEVLHGLREGEEVVGAGVFLIDSESRLRASGGGAAHAHGSMDAKPSADPHAGH